MKVDSLIQVEVLYTVNKKTHTWKSGIFKVGNLKWDKLRHFEYKNVTMICPRFNGKETYLFIQVQGIMALALGTDDESIQAEMKAYKDILNGVKEQPTIPYNMKWNPDCEDCLPEGIDDCIECHKRMEGR